MFFAYRIKKNVLFKMFFLIFKIVAVKIVVKIKSGGGCLRNNQNDQSKIKFLIRYCLLTFNNL